MNSRDLRGDFSCDADDRRLRRLSARHGQDTAEVSRLDAKTHALVRLGAAPGIDASPSSYQCTIDPALAGGASIDEIVGT
jgi:hypothetical protein